MKRAEAVALMREILSQQHECRAPWVPPMEMGGVVYEPNCDLIGMMAIATDDGAGNKSKATLPVGKAADGRFYFAAARPKK